MSRHSLITLLVGMAGVLLIGMAQNIPHDEALPHFEQAPCTYALPRDTEVLCGFLVVPEDRSDPASGLIRLSVALVRSAAPHPQPDPVVVLSGGPGGITTPYLPFVLRPNYRPFLEARDLIFFDQRGVGASVPALECDTLMALLLEKGTQPLSSAERARLEAEHLLECQAEYDNPAAYTTAHNAADLDDLRVALGYETWNLFGISYGTKLALTALRDYPEGIRSVILDSVYPPEVNLYTELAQNQQRAFDLLFASCAADAECSAAYPALEIIFYGLIEAVNDQPYTVKGRYARGAFDYELHITGDMIADHVFSLLYSRQAIPDIPALINDLRTEERRQPMLESIAIARFDQILNLSEGMYYSVQCNEEAALTTSQAALDTAVALHPALQAGFVAKTEALFKICAGWRTAPAPPSASEPVYSEAPALLLAGQFDPITPPAWGQQAAQNLPNSYFYVFPTVGHGVIRTDECAMSIALQFLDSPTTPPDVTCIEAMPPLVFRAP